ncbi:hypothetical protein EZ216_03400 [Ramlibacter humi]|uniref:GH26 domain-containing protein n=2 Tax=Ramlibacter humi TaxID=2530451 RepID=A0A4Z0CEF4_9BURK|nr:hypothetical protein EZ216_03400 [Ramlibacter humi]
MGKPQRFLSGLGTGNPTASIQSQNLHPDIYDAYLSGLGGGAWQDWNSPSGAYVNVHAAKADAMGAVPMFTLYQMAANGDGNLAGLTDASFMSQYWANVRLMFQRLAIYDKPAFVVVEPDFWGYVQLAAPGGDPRQMAARVTDNADCANQPDNVTGIAGCIVQMARQYAPKAAIGFMPSRWGASSAAQVASFMRVVGAQSADFVAMETLDRDAGCFEAQAAGCTRSGSGWYWDDNAFRTHLADAKTMHDVVGLPLVWWQTPMGVPSATPGGSNGQWRDNRVQYFLTHAADLVAAGGLGAVFSWGASGQTSIDTDGGQYKRLSEAYLASPAALP